ncbi:MAG: hypothetical protein Q9223_000002 [Gallowayella weberi]
MLSQPPPPAFSDIAKASNDLINRDFYHAVAANLEVKSKAPNGVTFNVKGKSSHEGSTNGSAWSTSNVLNTKVELDNMIAKGVKADLMADILPNSMDIGAKANLAWKQPMFHARAFVDFMKGPSANFDAVVGREGFLAGAEAGYDVEKAAITRYSLAAGYAVPTYSATITAANNMNVFSAAYHHKVNSEVEAGAKATWDAKGSNNVGLEVAGKYRLDPASFAKGKVNDRGIACLAYNVLLRSGVTLGLGVSLDTQKLNESAHKVGGHIEFSG